LGKEKRMWLFVYGSLMCEDTLEKLGGKRFDGAFLKNYRRDFNKQSVERWGTKANAGPTLGLERAKGSGCTGALFEFSRKDARNARAGVERREGRSFTLKRRPVRLPNGREVLAYTPINSTTANSYIGNLSLQQRAQMVLAANGTAGSCYNYVCNIARILKKLGIRDQEVETFKRTVERVRQSGRP
jgi:cation transport protein ChaC